MINSPRGSPPSTPPSNHFRLRSSHFNAVPSRNPKCLLSVVLEGDEAQAAEYLIHGAPVEGNLNLNEDGCFESPTPLMAALLKGNVSMVSLLLKHGANVNTAMEQDIVTSWHSRVFMANNIRRSSPLLLAIESDCDIKILKLLVSYGADVQVGSNNNYWQSSSLFPNDFRRLHDFKRRGVIHALLTHMYNQITNHAEIFDANPKKCFEFVEKLKFLLQSGAHAEEIGMENKTPLEMVLFYKKLFLKNTNFFQASYSRTRRTQEQIDANFEHQSIALNEMTQILLNRIKNKEALLTQFISHKDKTLLTLFLESSTLSELLQWEELFPEFQTGGILHDQFRNVLDKFNYYFETWQNLISHEIKILETKGATSEDGIVDFVRVCPEILKYTKYSSSASKQLSCSLMESDLLNTKILSRNI